jgi:LmbE family N-acetylglucosaminyl deacetylase
MKILAFFAHPDDETMLAGGTLALLAQSGAEVHYLCATRGEGGEAGEPPVCEIEELGRVRAKEMACAVQSLGGRSLAFLDYIDPRVGPGEELYAYTDDLAQLAEEVGEAIRRLEIDALLTHGVNGEYGHPAHKLTHQAALKAVQTSGVQQPLFYTVSAFFPEHPRPRLANQDNPAHLILDVSPCLTQKTEAALCHRSQHALFVRRSSQEAGRRLSVPEVIQRLESLHRLSPAVNGRLDDELAMRLSAWAVSTT